MTVTLAAARSQRGALVALLAVYFFLGSLYAVQTPDWQAPDEPAHYNYIGYVVEEQSLPVLEAGDYDQAYLERLKAERFPPDLPVTAVSYEDWQPPLYYLLAAPVYAATNGALLGVRLFTLLLGAGVVVMTWRIARLVMPEAPGVALAAAGFVAFLPQHLAMLAAANNDALGELWMAVGMWLCLRAVLAPQGGPRPAALQMGVVLGLGFLTKLSVYPLAGLMGLALALAARREGWGLGRLAGEAARLFGPALVLGGLWWVRNLVVYGGLDFLAFERHDAVVVGQPRTVEKLAEWGAAGYLQRFLQTTFQSFWGQFGWMGVLMDRRVYWALLAYTLLIVTGFVGAGVERYRQAGRGLGLSAEQRDAVMVLGAAVLLAAAVYLYYNLSFVQFQGRYLYPALPAIALGAAIGLRAWARWGLALAGRMGLRWPARRERVMVELLPLVPVGMTAVLAFVALYWFVVQQLAAY
jgi:4-amino-4-deoxy-L-arabinose transferase-like glycosyltransferase